eukprot:11413609-Karenia_brevis.AAC.1
MLVTQFTIFRRIGLVADSYKLLSNPGACLKSIADERRTFNNVAMGAILETTLSRPAGPIQRHYLASRFDAMDVVFLFTHVVRSAAFLTPGSFDNERCFRNVISADGAACSSDQHPMVEYARDNGAR